MNIVLFGNADSNYLLQTAKALIQNSNNIYIWDKSGYKIHSIDINTTKNDLISKRNFKNINYLSKIIIFTFNILYSLVQLVHKKKYDIIDIHYFDSPLIVLFFIFKKIAKGVNITIYGDDFNSASKLSRFILKIAFTYTDSIFLNNPLAANKIDEYYKFKFKNKIRICRFGLPLIKKIKSAKSISKQILKEKYGYPLNKIIINIGHSSTYDEQQIEVLNSLIQFEDGLAEKIFIVIYHTYGSDKDLTNKIISILNKTKFKYKIYNEFIDLESFAEMKVATDLMIHVLKNDQFSASVLESLYAENTVIIGEWLPYSILSEINLKFINIKSISSINNILLNYNFSLNIQSTESIEKLERWISWEYCIEDWLNGYSRILSNKFK